MPDTRTIMLIRHGATSLNNDDVSVDRIRGWKDVPLSKEGEAEGHRIAAKIEHNPPDKIVTSDLHRAHETAEIIAKHLGMKISLSDKAFRPWNVGVWAGKVSKEAVPVLTRFAAQEPDKDVPEGESFNDFRRRFFCGLSSALEAYSGIVAVITHHRCERLLKAWQEEGHSPEGDLKMTEFNVKGEPTGHVELLQIPMKALHSACREMMRSPERSKLKQGPRIAREYIS